MLWCWLLGLREVIWGRREISLLLLYHLTTSMVIANVLSVTCLLPPYVLSQVVSKPTIFPFSHICLLLVIKFLDKVSVSWKEFPQNLSQHWSANIPSTIWYNHPVWLFSRCLQVNIYQAGIYWAPHHVLLYVMAQWFKNLKI